MNSFYKHFYNLPTRSLAYIASALTIVQIGLAVFLYGRSSEAVEWAGWICIWISAVFGWLPIITFRKKGGVPEGKSYVDTTRLVDSGSPVADQALLERVTILVDKDQAAAAVEALEKVADKVPA
ncbi:MAG: hypothetical protein ACK2TU_03810, partial [Anaerolineales bacterium]